jgi:hypothetical protein
LHVGGGGDGGGFEVFQMGLRESESGLECVGRFHGRESRGGRKTGLSGKGQQTEEEAKK